MYDHGMYVHGMHRPRFRIRNRTWGKTKPSRDDASSKGNLLYRILRTLLLDVVEFILNIIVWYLYLFFMRWWYNTPTISPYDLSPEPSSLSSLPLDDLVSPRSNLPPDILLDILCRLPVKSIVRFKSVSKQWEAVLSHPSFANMQFDYTTKLATECSTRDSFICMTQGILSYKLTADAPRFPKGWEFLGIRQPAHHHIVGTSKGWICLTRDEEYLNHFIITNPALEFNISLRYPRKFLLGARLTLGFGYDHHNDDFKLLRLERRTYESNLRSAKIDIYSVRSKSWKSITSTKNIFPTSCFPAAIVGSRLYWKSTAKNDNNNTRIAMFDLSSETFHVSDPVPVGVRAAKSRLDVVAVREESVALIYSDYEQGNIQMWTVSPEDLTFNEVETTCLDVPSYSAEKCLDWLKTHYGWIIGIQRNGDLMVRYRKWFGFHYRLFSLKENNFVDFVDHPTRFGSHVWCFRESLISC